MFKLSGKRFKKKEKGGCSLAGRRQPTGPASEARPAPAARASPPSSRLPQRQRRARPTAWGPRRRVADLRARPAPRPRLACHRHQRTRHSLLSPMRSLSPPRPRSDCTSSAVTIGAPELLRGRFSPRSATFLDSSLPELHFRLAVPERTS